MSYVIQNFFDYNKKIILTPRFKSLLFFLNLKFFIIFIKLKSFFFFNNNFNIYSFNYFFCFFKYFFSSYMIKLLYKNNISSVSNYTNNLIKSYSYNIFFFIQFYLLKKTNFLIFKHKHFLTRKLLFNLYFLSFKIANIKLNKNFYKNIVFFFFINNFYIWNQFNQNFKFYLNFIFVNYLWKISRFYNTPFLKIYSY